MAIYDVTDLIVYKRSLSILNSTYTLIQPLPFEHNKLRIQIIKSPESVPPLIAEGFAKRSSKAEFLRFLRMALGSSDETITHAREIYIISMKNKKINRSLCVKVGTEYKIISKQLNSLIKKWTHYSQK